MVNEIEGIYINYLYKLGMANVIYMNIVKNVYGGVSMMDKNGRRIIAVMLVKLNNGRLIEKNTRLLVSSMGVDNLKATGGLILSTFSAAMIR